jgi:hypothetical protein
MKRMFVVSMWMSSCWGCLRPPCGGHARLGALENLEEGLLHALAGYVARDGEVLRLAGDLVDLVDVDDAKLGAGDVTVGRRDELEQDVLDVLAHVASLGESGGVRDGEGHLEEAGEGLRKQRLARAGGAKEQDVALGDLDFLLALGDLVIARKDAAIVVVDGNAHRTLGRLLANHVLRELVVDLMRGGKLLER